MTRFRTLVGLGLALASMLPRAARAEPAPAPPASAPADAQTAAPTSPEAAALRPADTPTTGAFRTPSYDNGFVFVDPVDPVRTPYRLVLKHVSQFKYSNSLAIDDTYTDHLGREQTVQRRNDIQLTRDVFYFRGFVFDQNLDFNILIYTSSATLSATAAGYVGYVFSDAFKLRAGFFSLPSLRSMTGTYPFFPGTDRSMATNYMRPGFTQGVWAEGVLPASLNYIAMVGNSLNTLDIATPAIDNSFAASASIWFDVNDFNFFWSDYEQHENVSLRIGTAFTYAREDRLSDLSQASPENNATFISDGNLLFETGALAPDVTIELASFYLSAIDVGVKYRGLALNAELYNRWLNNFDADGPLPVESMHDWGFEASASYFVLPKRLETYARTSLVSGPFGTGYEVAPGLRWHPFETRHVWIDGEVIWVDDCPFGSVLYIYSAGASGVMVPIQFLVRF